MRVSYFYRNQGFSYHFWDLVIFIEIKGFLTIFPLTNCSGSGRPKTYGSGSGSRTLQNTNLSPQSLKFVRLFLLHHLFLHSILLLLLLSCSVRTPCVCVCGRAGSVQFIHTFSTSFFPPPPPPPRPLLWWPLCGGGGGKTENCTCLIFFIFLSVFCFPLYTPTFLSSYLTVAPSGVFVFEIFGEYSDLE